MKKFLSILMILALALSMGTMAFADGEATKTYNITVTNGTGHTYNVYQIFTGDYNKEPPTEDGYDGVLSNVAFGKNYAVAENETVKSELATLEGMSGAEAAAYLQGKLNSESPIAVLNNENNYTTNQVGGYYLIVDVTENLPEGDTTSAYIIQVVGDTNIASKHNTVTVSKKVDDKNDSNVTEDKIEWHDSADHDIGDLIDFQLSATIGNEFDKFVEAKKAYKMTFHDTEEEGLTFKPDSVKVYIDGTEITSGYEVVSDPDDDCTFDIVFADLTKIADAKAGAVITVEYKSELNEEAIIGSKGNVNEVYGEFDNFYNPEQPVITPKDTVIVFTYKVVVNKVDKDMNKLAGAEFTLEKKVLKTPEEGETPAVYEWMGIDVVEAKPDTTFTFKGLDDGDYRLTETVTPAGYNTIDPIEFTVTADHDIKWTTQERTDILTSLTGDVATGELTFTADKAEGSLSADVINQKGVELPETGGVGTTLFYIFGGCLVLGAIVLMITKKRMKNAEE